MCRWKSIWFRAELNFCPKIVAGRSEADHYSVVIHRIAYTTVNLAHFIFRPADT